MKVRSIIMYGMLLLGVGAATTSCEDMFEAENKLVTTDLEPQDTVYQVMGIVKRMQKLADRTVLLGEVRADLVDVDASVASTDIQQLSNNNVSLDNVYNKPVDYYAVINSCNIYLAKVDSLLKSHGEVYYEKEVCAVKSFRAWCYLELAKIYGSVPFVTEPVITADAADEIVASGTKADMGTILDFCINDLQKYPYMDKNNALRPKYGNQNWNGISYDNMFIPVRALLAELYLWRGTYTGSQADYINAIRMYHDYFTFRNEEHGVGTLDVRWSNRDFRGTSDSYSLNRFSLSNSSSAEQAGVLPCDTVAYYGNTSDLRTIFNSQYRNNYYPWVTPSQRIYDISAAQWYCYYDYTSATVIDTLYGSRNANDYTKPILLGDLRLYAVYNTTDNLAESKYNANVNNMKSYIAKWTNGSIMLGTDAKNPYIPYYRNTILYLHMAEALNRAGFPETAYAVLAYGLTYKVMNNRNIISQDEFDRLCEIKSFGFSNEEPNYSGDLAAKTNSSFVIWRSDKFDNPEKNQASGRGGHALDPTSQADIVQIGIHSIGSGDTEYNQTYYLDDAETLANLKEHVVVPDTVALGRNATAEDSLAWEESIEAYNAALEQNLQIDQDNADYLASAEVRTKRQARVAQLVLEEEALEGAFEGLRFYDLMRYQMQEGKFATTITMPDYITDKYGASDRLTGKPWYLTMPAR